MTKGSPRRRRVRWIRPDALKLQRVQCGIITAMATKSSKWKPSFLREPPGPGTLRICPRCKKWFALVHVRTDKHPTLSELAHYKCKSCGLEVRFGKSFPKSVP
jgi:hypothetical protein